MAAVVALWLPILLSSVAVFVTSSIIHMLSPWHKSDYPKLANQDQVMDALRPLAIPAGDYFIPRPTTRKEMGTPEFQEKFKKGPVMVFTVMPGAMTMGRNLGLWFVYIVVVGTCAAYLGAHAVPAGSTYRPIFRFVGLSAFMGYTLGLWQMSIWYHRSWSTTIKSTVDGAIYAALTAATFVWLWPR